MGAPLSFCGGDNAADLASLLQGKAPTVHYALRCDFLLPAGLINALLLSPSSHRGEASDSHATFLSCRIASLVYDFVIGVKVFLSENARSGGNFSHLVLLPLKVRFMWSFARFFARGGPWNPLQHRRGGGGGLFCNPQFSPLSYRLTLRTGCCCFTTVYYFVQARTLGALPACPAYVHTYLLLYQLLPPSELCILHVYDGGGGGARRGRGQSI